MRKKVRSKNFKFKTEEEKFNFCANRSVKEITQMFYDNIHENIVRQSIRYFLSRFMCDRGIKFFRHGETPTQEYKCNIILYSDDAMGLSSNQMPIISRIITDVIYGIIWFKLDDCNEEFDFETKSKPGENFASAKINMKQNDEKKLTIDYFAPNKKYYNHFLAQDP